MPRAVKKFDQLSKETQKRIFKGLRILSINPRKHRHIKKIHGSKFGYRLRLGRWRILFAVFRKEKRIEVVDIFLRKEKDDYGKRKFF